MSLNIHIYTEVIVFHLLKPSSMHDNSLILLLLLKNRCITLHLFNACNFINATDVIHIRDKLSDQ